MQTYYFEFHSYDPEYKFLEIHHLVGGNLTPFVNPQNRYDGIYMLTEDNATYNMWKGFSDVYTINKDAFLEEAKQRNYDYMGMEDGWMKLVGGPFTLLIRDVPIANRPFFVHFGADGFVPPRL